MGQPQPWAPIAQAQTRIEPRGCGVVSAAPAVPDSVGSSIILSSETKTNPFKGPRSRRQWGMFLGELRPHGCSSDGDVPPNPEGCCWGRTRPSREGICCHSASRCQNQDAAHPSSAHPVPPGSECPNQRGLHPTEHRPLQGGKHRPVPTPPSWAPSPPPPPPAPRTNNPSSLAGSANERQPGATQPVPTSSRCHQQ